MSILDRMGWSPALQAEIKHVVRNTRESIKHVIVGMRVRVFPEELFIRVYDRTGLTTRVLCDSKPFDDREAQIDAYDKIIKHLDLPYCCKVHKEERHGPEFEFVTDDDEFEFVTEDDDEFEFLDPDEDDDEFDLADPDEDAWDEADPDEDGFDFS